MCSSDLMVRYVERNYCKNITLQDIATQLHANQSYLSRLYKTCSGVNLFDDIQRRRIAKAKERLLASDWKVQAVAEYVGFEDSAYFSRVFKKETGMSPKEYRNAHEKNKNFCNSTFHNFRCWFYVFYQAVIYSTLEILHSVFIFF